VPTRPLAIEPLDEQELADESGEYDGARLKRARLRRGLEIEQIAGVTKINPAYLRFIEEDRFDVLPSSVYVRGFVSAYMRCVGIDPAKGASAYMERFEAARGASNKGARRERD
jgi:cytoskeletal protein RodZ